MNAIPHLVTVDGDRAVTIMDAVLHENRWFRLTATGDRPIFAATATATATDADDSAAVVVQLDVVADAADFGPWRVESVSVSLGDPASGVMYSAQPGQPHPLSRAPQGLRELVAHFVARDPAALATVTDDIAREPALLRRPLVELLTRLLDETEGSIATVRAETLAAGVLDVVFAALPPRTVLFQHADNSEPAAVTDTSPTAR